MGPNNTPPASPGIPVTEDDTDDMYDDDVAEVIDAGEGEIQGDLDDEIDDEEDLVELPGGVDQLEALLEEHENRIEDMSRLTFSEHSGSVFCCCIGDEGLVASGGEDDKCLVWRLSDGGLEQEIKGWGDSVTALAWSTDKHYLAVGDMGGNVKVFRYPGFQQVWSFDVEDILWLCWHPVANVLFCGTADSQTWMWKIPSGDSKLLTGAGARAECGTLLSDGKRAVVGYGDGTLRQFDLKSGETQMNMVSSCHIDSVNCVAAHPGREVVVSGGMDGMGIMWNTTNGKQLGLLMCGDKQEENSPHSVECLQIPKDKSSNVVVTGTLGGIVAVWDLSSQIARSTVKVGEGVTVLKVGEDSVQQGMIFAGTLEGAVRVIDARTGASVAEYTGHRGNILDLQLGPNTLITAGDDGTVKVFDYRISS